MQAMMINMALRFRPCSLWTSLITKQSRIPKFAAICTTNFNFERRSYGVRSGRIISSPEAADRFIRWLGPQERHALKAALVRREVEEHAAGEGIHIAPTVKQLRLLAFANSMPFVGFGLLDNAIMIMAGEYIDSTLGVVFGISTMAAAALGNLISDLCGLGLAGYVEVLVGKLGYDAPQLTAEQMTLWQTRYATYMGRCLGVIIGCLIGMFPLLFIGSETNKDAGDCTEKKKILAET